MQGQRSPNGSKIWYNCAVCGTKSFVYACRLKRSYRVGIYCSMACQRIGVPKKPKTLIAARCDHCGQAFQYRKQGEYRAIYCRDECRHKGQVGKVAGANHPKWKGGISDRPHVVRKAIRMAIKEAGMCARCGSTDNLQGHHVKPYSEFPELGADQSNIAVECSQCAKDHPDISAFIAIPRVRRGQYLPCEHCHVLFYVRPGNVDKARFCSRACNYSHPRNAYRVAA